MTLANSSCHINNAHEQSNITVSVLADQLHISMMRSGHQPAMAVGNAMTLIRGHQMGQFQNPFEVNLM
jgi:hypothetical protein